MKKIFCLVVLCALSASTAYAHGNISKLPNSVQILQYKMQLYMNKDDVGILNNLAMAYFRNNQFEEAKEQLESVLKKDKINFDALDGMGLVHLKTGDSKKAVRYLKKALSVNKDDVMVHVHLSLNYEKLGLTDLAKKEMDEAESLASEGEGLQIIEKEIEVLGLIGQ